MNYLYASGAMGFGRGYAWHRWLGYTFFPNFPVVTKTITLKPVSGYPFAIVRMGNTVYNHVAHHNKGFQWFVDNHLHTTGGLFPGKQHIIVSIAGTDDEIAQMVDCLDYYPVDGVQLSFSCPNVRNMRNRAIPPSRHPIYLKLNHLQDPYKYDLSRVSGVMMNSVPCWFGGMSGKGAQPKNWAYTRKFNREGLNIFGSSWVTETDIKFLEEWCGCTTMAIGSVMLINPGVVENLWQD